MLTLLLDQDTIYIFKYFCMRYFMNTGNGQRINIINANEIERIEVGPIAEL